MFSHVFVLLFAGAHGVYLIPSDQCPTSFPPGPDELYAAAAPTSMNNVLSVNLTSPGIFYFACQVYFASFNLGLYLLVTDKSTLHVLMLLKVGDHCIEDGQKLVVSVTNATAGMLSGLGNVVASTG